MEFVDGVTLKARLLAGELAIEEACTIARQMLLGLDAVHAAGVLHLDFKSQNVMLRHGKTPAQAVVMDFSLSRAFENELRLRTSERHAAGSIGYMSPEQLECQSTLGPAADVYAFGVVFYEMLTGHMPFQGDSPAAIMLKQLKSRAAPPSRLRPALSPALDEFVLTCLGRQARSRFQSAASALQALDGCLPARGKERRRSASWLRTLGVAVLAAAAAGALVHRASRSTAAEAALASAAAPLKPPPPADSAPPAAGPAREPDRASLQRPQADSVAAPRPQRDVPPRKRPRPPPATERTRAEPSPESAAPQPSPDTLSPDTLSPDMPSPDTPPPDRQTQKPEWVPQKAPDSLL
jgi:serine/threonine-protein kinase